jgi:hypothetical protein
MRDVEWTFVAAEPQPVGVEVPVTTTLGPGVLVVPEVACSNGSPVRINKALDPTFATTSGWSPSAANTSWGIVTDTTSPYGSTVAQLAATASNPADKTLVYGPVPAEGGMPQSFSFAWNSNYIGMSLTVTAEAYYSPPDSYLLTSQVVATDVTSAVDDWGGAADRVGFTWTPPGQTDTVVYRLTFHAPAWPTGRRVRLDGLLYEDSAMLGTYFDGTYPDSFWTGTANASPSAYEKSSLSAILDPGLPATPGPAPPAGHHQRLRAAVGPVAALRGQCARGDHPARAVRLPGGDLDDGRHRGARGPGAHLPQPVQPAAPSRSTRAPTAGSSCCPTCPRTPR